MVDAFIFALYNCNNWHNEKIDACSITTEVIFSELTNLIRYEVCRKALFWIKIGFISFEGQVWIYRSLGWLSV